MVKVTLNYICKGFFIIVCVMIGHKAYDITSYKEKPVDIPSKVTYTENCYERNTRMLLAYNEEPKLETLKMLCD